jgi:Domain of unknown function (DUF4259)
MGTWGSGPFDNDDAADWTYRLTPDAEIGVVTAALNAALADDRPDAATSQAAVAAAEVVAAALGHRHVSTPEEVTAWVAARPGPQWRDAAPLAARSTQRVLADSELRELWDESDEDGEWSAELVDLVSRLAG